LNIKEIQDKLNKNGWVAMLWHVDDVKQNYNVTDEDAIDILKDALIHSKRADRVMEEVFCVIDEICELEEIERNELD